VQVSQAADRKISRRAPEETSPAPPRRTSARTSLGSVGAMMHNILQRNTKVHKTESLMLLASQLLEGAEAGDPIDQCLLQHLTQVSQDACPQFKVKKLGLGRYNIDGRTVCVRWRPQAGTSPTTRRDSSDLLAREQDIDVGEEMPLVSYLSSAANVSASLRGRSPGAPAVARLPKDKRLTFGGASTSSSDLQSMDVLQRCESMRKACEEAQLREWAAEAYEHGVSWPSVPAATSLSAITASQRQQQVAQSRAAQRRRSPQRPPPSMGRKLKQHSLEATPVEQWLESL